MPAITLKNIPEDLYAEIKQSAQTNYRSIASEILFRLHTSLGHAPIDRELLVRRLLDARGKRQLPKLTDDVLEQAKNQGRS